MARVKFFNKKTGRTEEREQTPEEIATQKQQQEAAKPFVQAREKAESRGATKEEAVRIASQGQSQGETTVKEVRARIEQGGAPAQAEEIPIGVNVGQKPLIGEVGAMGRAAEVKTLFDTASQEDIVEASRLIRQGGVTPEDVVYYPKL